ncbi:MAG TPA: VWA domain-containing protein [Bryobacteraceae bacterium]|jgi:VWFA-related protein|nr:VWA domain-containing protein [Bryobacteraceae bacterium]
MKRVLFCLIVGLPALAQEQSPPKFRSEAPLVILPVAVSDKSGKLVDNIDANDFVVLDNGQPRPAHVDAIGTFRTKMALVIVIQTSGISQSALLKIDKVGSLIEGYITGEGSETAVLSVDSDVKLIQPFTTDGSRIRDAFESLKPSDSAREAHQLDGIEQAITMLAQRPAEDRRFILVIGETRDRGSKRPSSDVMRAAQLANATIYTLTYSAYITPFTTKADELAPSDDGGIMLIVPELAHLAKRNIGQALADSTGGRHLSFNTLHALEGDMVRVGKEVHHQYLISFTPGADATPEFHTIVVKVKSDPKLSVHTRSGYWSTPAN